MTHLVTHPDFAIGVHDQVPQWTKQLSDISAAEVESYFHGPRLDMIDDAVVPTKDYYHIPDNVRRFLNEQTVYGDIQARKAQSIDIVAYLKNINLPFTDRSVGCTELRRLIVSHEERKRKTLLRVTKLQDLCSS
jgi:hypothetical protein